MLKVCFKNGLAVIENSSVSTISMYAFITKWKKLATWCLSPRVYLIQITGLASSSSVSFFCSRSFFFISSRSRDVMRFILMCPKHHRRYKNIKTSTCITKVKVNFKNMSNLCKYFMPNLDSGFNKIYDLPMSNLLLTRDSMDVPAAESTVDPCITAIKG